MRTPDRRCQYIVRICEYIVPTITPLQMKLARTALGLGVRELATAAGVAPSTVQRFESGHGDMHSRTLERVQQALEAGGIVFVYADEHGGPGVRLR
jgi:predicted transcriptional regulator